MKFRFKSTHRVNNNDNYMFRILGEVWQHCIIQMVSICIPEFLQYINVMYSFIKCFIYFVSILLPKCSIFNMLNNLGLVMVISWLVSTVVILSLFQHIWKRLDRYDVDLLYPREFHCVKTRMRYNIKLLFLETSGSFILMYFTYSRHLREGKGEI